jgi:hypothetical protein
MGESGLQFFQGEDAVNLCQVDVKCARYHILPGKRNRSERNDSGIQGMVIFTLTFTLPGVQ